MAIIKIIGNAYADQKAVYDLLHYALTDKENGGGVRYYGAIGVNLNGDLSFMAEQFRMVKRAFGKMNGRQVRHIIVSFDPDDQIGPYCASMIAFKIAQYYGEEFQVVYGVHEDTNDLHVHFIINTVSYIDGKKFSRGPAEVWTLRAYVEQVINSFRAIHKKVLLEAFDCC